MLMRMSLPRTLLVLPISLALLALTPPPSPPKLDQLGWLAGHWVSVDDKNGRVDEETWMQPADGLMPGMHRSHGGGRPPFFEHLRMVVQEGAIRYIASPAGKGETSFRLSSLGRQRVVFENPTHDYPRRITYWLDKDGEQLHARIDEGGEKPVKIREWTFRRSALTPAR